ncbi:MAG TPA: FAD-dependent oxidoreductase [Chitinophagaceae bacterium]|nr:FAD-dependent oxidoreductase [Chitinophagaceae bacterium]
MKIVVIGGGFAGLQLVQRLANKSNVEVWLLDKHNYHQFQPLFYQVATAGLDASNISFPFRKALQSHNNVFFRVALVKKIEVATRQVITDNGTYNYDMLVIATGADTNFFGNEQLQAAALPMKSTNEALQLRHKLIAHWEAALTVKENAAALAPYLNIVVVGGGPTGVELSGTLAEQRLGALAKDYPELPLHQMKIYLLEGSNRLLGGMSEVSSNRAKRYLEKLGVTVLNNTLVTDFDGTTVRLQNGNAIESKLVIWAAGIKGNIPAGIHRDVVARGNRIKVDRQHKVLGTENIYALGDVAYMETPLYPNGHPQVANVAISQAKNLANNIEYLIASKNDKIIDFEYEDKGSMATVGRHLAVVDVPKPKLHIGGWLAWFIWMGLHLVLILGVKNRIQVFINWVYKYFTYDQSLRLWFKDYNAKSTA